MTDDKADEIIDRLDKIAKLLTEMNKKIPAAGHVERAIAKAADDISAMIMLNAPD